MTVGEVMMVGEYVGKKYVDEIAEQIVKNMIAEKISNYRKSKVLIRLKLQQ